LIVEIAGGAPGPVVEAVLPEHLPQPRTIALRRARLARVLGMAIADDAVVRILRALGLDVVATADGWSVTAPTRRFDLAIEEDLIEEIARIHGYDAIPATLPGGATRLVTPSESKLDEGDLRRQLAARDYLEAVNYAFVDAALLDTWQAGAGGVQLANPLSAELGVMRTQLLPGLVAALARNVARQQSRVRLFEIGKVFGSRESATENREPGETEGAPVETPRIAAVACGDAVEKAWDAVACQVDFHDIKGDLDALAALSGAMLDYRPPSIAWCHPGRSADVHRIGEDGDAVRIGWIGELHPRLLRALDLEHAVIAFEVDLAALQRRSIPKAAALSKFPSVRRDLAFVVAEEVPWAAISATARRAAGSQLRELTLFDRYVGEGVETGFKSLAMGLILQDDSRTLTDRDVDAVVARVVDGLHGEHGARMRG
jgi:phenylalanyl-tRNA synthetase beta chain